MNLVRKLVGPVVAAILSVPVALSGVAPAIAATVKKHVKGSGEHYNASERIAFQFFLAQGYKPAAAAGIVGNLSHESNRFDPRVVSGKIRGDHGRSAHVAQWNGQRLANLHRFAGTHTPTLLQQLQFIIAEGKSGGAFADSGAVTALHQLRTIKSVQAASDIFRDHFERPSAKDRTKRRAHAKRIAQQFVHAATAHTTPTTKDKR